MSENRVEIDWVHLPASVEPQSLWTCLHDAELTAVTSDLWNRTVVLEFDVLHLRKHHHLPEDLRFRCRLCDVRSVRAVAFAYPEPPLLNGLTLPAPPEVAGMSVEEQLHLKGEYTARGRDESVSWGSFEAALADTRFEVLEAEFVQNSETVALHLEGRLDDEYWYRLFLQAGSLAVERSDGAACSLERFIALGDAYWEAFSSREE
jgi:hypothetical protein